ncbi:type IX secretion system protein PorQ [Chryseobacterium bernardetii]|uniref:Penicillin-binding protein n=1 Tax=Chryseobacterium bernardetii TaxID=1241978 RepID=A0A3G6TIX7_9FLAO|nr:type IX secretion system protein PorQ [Chryseobacterium bernardetii]AZB26224.1 penicillin-binding protein [Chryseobacterium bernardetii]AZB32732.1 penicillin-binding protein [Chryseobacterium bernardetii]
MKKIIIFSLFLSGIVSYAQTGTNVYPFLNVPVSARQAALGGDAISIRDYDVSFAIANPALLNKDSDKQLSVNATAYLADSKYGTIAYAKDFDNGHMATINARYMSYGSIPRTDENGFQDGEYKASDVAIGAGYAYQFEEDWTIGGGLNFITSKIDNYTSSAISGTAGITYHNKKNKEVLSLVLRNFGFQLKSFNGTRENLPFRVDVGYTRILKNFPLAITVTAHDLQQFNISSEYNKDGQKVNAGRKIADHFSLGAELFPEKNFNIRLGYNVKRGNELAVADQRNFSGLSGGFGIKVSRFRIDYAHIRYHNSSNVNQIGVSMDLSSHRGE